MTWVILIAVVVAGFFVFQKIRDERLLNTVTRSYRGTKTERDLVLKLLKYGLPAETLFHDLYIKKSNGKLSQIDLVAVTGVGVIVFEIKKLSGWIFGNGRQSQWTQVLAYGKVKYRFYNPILQNHTHIEELRRQLKQLDNVPFYSVIVFYGDCVLKDVSFVPKGTFLVKPPRILEMLKIIIGNNAPFYYTNKNEVFMMLKQAVENGESIETQNRHIENIKDMLGKDRIFD